MQMCELGVLRLQTGTVRPLTVHRPLDKLIRYAQQNQPVKALLALQLRYPVFYEASKLSFSWN